MNVSSNSPIDHSGDSPIVISLCPRYNGSYTAGWSSSSPSPSPMLLEEDETQMAIKDVKYVTYGILWPTICVLGILGNVLNLIVLSQPNMKGTAYIYMRGYSSAALMAILVAIPFAVRVLFHNEVGEWTNIYLAFFHTYLELYLGNSCLGIGVMMLVALTMERFVAVCHPEKSRALQGSRKAYLIIASIPICTLLVYTPHLFRSKILHCLTLTGEAIYQKQDDREYLESNKILVYKWFLAIVFRLGPTILLAYLNLRIIIAYRRTCAKRRTMTGKSRDDTKKFAEENRIMLLLGSTSILFFVCVTPMVLLSVMISEAWLKSFSFQVFRSTANLLEVTNYSLTFYIYCLFSREFRNTFMGLFSRSGRKGSFHPPGGQTSNPKGSGGSHNNLRVHRPGSATPTPTAEAHGAGSTPLLSVKSNSNQDGSNNTPMEHLERPFSDIIPINNGNGGLTVSEKKQYHQPKLSCTSSGVDVSCSRYADDLEI